MEQDQEMQPGQQPEQAEPQYAGMRAAPMAPDNRIDLKDLLTVQINGAVETLSAKLDGAVQVLTTRFDSADKRHDDLKEALNTRIKDGQKHVTNWGIAITSTIAFIGVAAAALGLLINS